MKVADKKLYDQSGGFDAADVLCQMEKLTSGTLLMTSKIEFAKLTMFRNLQNRLGRENC